MTKPARRTTSRTSQKSAERRDAKVEQRRRQHTDRYEHKAPRQDGRAA